MRQLHFDDAGQRLRVVGLRVDRDERFGRLQIVRLELEDLLVRLGRAIELLLLLAPQLRDLEEEADLRRRVRLLGLLLLEDADELVPLAALGVEDLEVVPPPEREVLLLDRLLGLAIVRVEGEELPPRGNRSFVVVQAIAVDRPELREDHDLRSRVVRELGLLFENGGELVELLAPLVETRQGPQRVRRWIVPAVQHLLPQGRCTPRASSPARSPAS